MGREARVKRDQPKSEPRKRREVNIWTASDVRQVLIPQKEKPATLDIDIPESGEMAAASVSNADGPQNP